MASRKGLFVSFMGNNDVRGLGLRDDISDRKGDGPLKFILTEVIKKVDTIYILNDFKGINCQTVKKRILELIPLTIKMDIKVIDVRKQYKDYSPAKHDIIYKLLKMLFNKRNVADKELYINLSSGTPHIISVLLLFFKSQFTKTSFFTTYYNRDVQQEVLERCKIDFDLNFGVIEESLKQQEAKKTTKKLEMELVSETPFLETEGIAKNLLQAKKVALYDVSCFILGETGSGKEGIAKHIVYHSSREKAKYRAFNCSSFSKELSGSELFGHVKGAFTGADGDKKGLISECDRGILFLDEVGDLSLSVQTQLLRFIQEGRYYQIGSTKQQEADVLIVVATHKDIYKMIEKGEFREDLFYRLAVEIINVKPLSKRREDIPYLAEFLLEKINNDFIKLNQLGYVAKKMTSDCLEMLKQHSWKGNIRELNHTLKRACMWIDGDEINSSKIKEYLFEQVIRSRRFELPELPIALNSYLKEYEDALINEALRLSSGNQSKAAILLEMDKTTLNKKIKKNN